MEKKITKTLRRIQNAHPEVELGEAILSRLSHSEIKILKNLKEKYDLSFFNMNNEKNISTRNDSEISEDSQKTLERINKGKEFEI